MEKGATATTLVMDVFSVYAGKHMRRHCSRSLCGVQVDGVKFTLLSCVGGCSLDLGHDRAAGLKAC